MRFQVAATNTVTSFRRLSRRQVAKLTAMITGVHTIIFGEDADAIRGFLGDTLGLEGVDAGGGWLIFKLPPAEVAAHPSDGGATHELYLMCDDIEATMADLGAKGVEFSGPANDEGWGVLTHIKVPGGGELGLYEPRHPTPLQPRSSGS